MRLAFAAAYPERRSQTFHRVYKPKELSPFYERRISRIPLAPLTPFVRFMRETDHFSEISYRNVLARNKFFYKGGKGSFVSNFEEIRVIFFKLGKKNEKYFIEGLKKLKLEKNDAIIL